MKQLTCEMCGSTDLLKQDGVFVCQSCGCKYSVEEARKMMIEGTVDIQGTVTVDNSAFVKKYLENARRAKEKEDWQETEKYYNMVEQNDPDNIEAIFYSAYGKAKSTLVDADIYKRQAAFKVLQNCISVIDDHYDPSRGEENRIAIEGMAKDITLMMCSNFVYTEWKNGYGVVTKTNKGETYVLFAGLIDSFRDSILNIAKVDENTYLYSSIILVCTTAKLIDFWKKNKAFQGVMDSYINEAQGRLDKIKNERINKYWEEHKEEKERLEAEKSSLQSEIDGFNATINSFEEVKVVARIQGQIDALRAEKDSLGLFKLKEKKAVQEKIDALDAQLRSAIAAKDQAIAPTMEQINQRQGRINEIVTELTKER